MPAGTLIASAQEALVLSLALSLPVIAVAALVGLVVLGQELTPREWLAVGCVMAACAGAARGAREPQAPQA